MSASGQPVIDYAFKTADLSDFFAMATDGDNTDSITSLSDYAKNTISLFGVPENFMNVIDNDYYIEKDLQGVNGIAKLGDGSTDPIALLYSEDGYEPYPGEANNNQDYYQVAVNDAYITL